MSATAAILPATGGRAMGGIAPGLTIGEDASGTRSCGRDGQIRTADLSLRRRPLYPSELRPRLNDCSARFARGEKSGLGEKPRVPLRGLSSGEAELVAGAEVAVEECADHRQTGVGAGFAVLGFGVVTTGTQGVRRFGVTHGDGTYLWRRGGGVWRCGSAEASCRHGGAGARPPRQEMTHIRLSDFLIR